MLLKSPAISIFPGVAPSPGSPGSYDCAPPSPGSGGGGAGSSGGGTTPGGCYPVPVITGYNPDGSPIISGFRVVCP